MDKGEKEFKQFSENFSLTSELLGQGAFGKVYKATHIKTGKGVAVKFETSNELKLLEKEYEVYEKLVDLKSKSKPIPAIYGYGVIGENAWIAMDLLGTSIGNIHKQRKTFSKETIMLLGYQMIECLEYLHVRNVVHCDIKGDNFAISGTDSKKIMIFDFGLACESRTVKPHFRGSPLYASVAAHRLGTITPKNDLESLGYLLSDFQSPLPWKSNKIIFPSDAIARLKQILDLKQRTMAEDLAKDFFELAEYIAGVNLARKPSHTLLKNIFSKKLNEMGSVQEFDWNK